MRGQGKARTRFIRYAMFVLGLAVVSLGCVLMIQADMGVASWDVLHIGLTHTFGLTIGIWSQIVGVLALLLSYLIARVKPGLGTILNMLLVGLFIDLFMWLELIPRAESLLLKVCCFASGMLLFAVGIGMYISPRMGAGPRDSLMLALNERMGWSIQRVRVTIELVVLALGWLLGGPVSIGTLLVALFSGPLIQRTIPFWERMMRERYGWVREKEIHP
ncbi:YczE/YyaS/YitT family protein [Brevibacillus marinus]|uniref:YczE/YyaS/YitT family protein n=1 Tax=Brevibacillus marinus TaxID=2496837 RepID=UPI001F496037|nr:YitT family protein [Brevibacillus marinus]